MSRQKTHISVIIPTYNRAQYIGSALDSVLSQKSEWPFEVIVVDDGSTDGTEEKIQKYGSKIHYYKLPHSGLPAVARNYGISKARGELIAFQDSDDMWLADKIISQAALFDDPEVILSYGNAEIITRDMRRRGNTVIPPGAGKSGHIFRELLQANIISTLTVIVRKKIIEEAEGFSESRNLRGVEDYELWLRLALRGKIIYLDKTLAKYRRHTQNISHTIPHKLNEHILEVYKSIMREDLTQEEKRAVRQEKINIYNINSRQLEGVNRRINELEIFKERILLKLS